MTDRQDAARSEPPGWRFTRWSAADGWPLRSYDCAPARDAGARGTMVFLAGRGDCPEKYFEAFAQWRKKGWAITGFDWRGQCGSGRLILGSNTGHIDRFDRYIDDLSYFWRTQLAERAGPHIVMAHSMGGHLALRAMAQGAIEPDAAVLVAPMLGFETGGLPLAFAAQLVAWAARRWPTARAWPSNERPFARSSRNRLLTHDDQRYSDELWWREQRPDLAMGPPSLAWLDQAYRSCRVMQGAGVLEGCQVPMLILGTTADALVSPDAIRSAAQRLPNATLHLYGAEAAHELLREADPVRDDVLARIDAFLADI